MRLCRGAVGSWLPRRRTVVEQAASGGAQTAGDRRDDKRDDALTMTNPKCEHARLFFGTDAAQVVDYVPHVSVRHAALVALHLEVGTRAVA